MNDPVTWTFHIEREADGEPPAFSTVRVSLERDDESDGGSLLSQRMLDAIDREIHAAARMVRLRGIGQ